MLKPTYWQFRNLSEKPAKAFLIEAASMQDAFIRAKRTVGRKHRLRCYGQACGVCCQPYHTVTAECGCQLRRADS